MAAVQHSENAAAGNTTRMLVSLLQRGPETRCYYGKSAEISCHPTATIQGRPLLRREHNRVVMELQRNTASMRQDLRINSELQNNRIFQRNLLNEAGTGAVHQWPAARQTLTRTRRGLYPALPLTPGEAQDALAGAKMHLRGHAAFNVRTNDKRDRSVFAFTTCLGGQLRTS